MSRPFAVAVAGAALLFAAGCGGMSDNTDSAAKPSTSSMDMSGGEPSSTAAPSAVVPTPLTVSGYEIQYHGERDVTDASSTEVVMQDIYFEPSVLIGSPGQKLQVKLVNKGHIEHTFTIDGQHIDAVLGAGKTATVTVTFPQSGRTPFVCRYHIGAGMAGVLAVRS